jgi:23S rRNA (adenine2503-C2)-methyltransferase
MAEFFQTAGEPEYRQRQFFAWLHARRVADFREMLDLPATLREKLAAAGHLRVLTEKVLRRSADGLTSKWLYHTPATPSVGVSPVESVLIVEQGRRRRTVCVSSMAGCPLGCVFCATGGLGFRRDLTAGEMLEQVYRADCHARENQGEGVSHVVFMGMGEPLLNLEAVLAAADRLGDPQGLGLSGRRLTLSTVGYPEGIRRLAEARRNWRLAVSLHAPRQELREKLVPAARRWPLVELFQALSYYRQASSHAITFEYCLVDRVNAGVGEARELVHLLQGCPARVNLIPLNPVDGFSGRPPPPPVVRRFQNILREAGIPATVRMEKGGDINAACGQLGGEFLAPTPDKP